MIPAGEAEQERIGDQVAEITPAQLQEFTALANARIAEWGDRIEPVTAGHVRLILCLLAEQPTADANERAYLDGYEAGRAAMAKWFHEQPAPEPEPNEAHGFYVAGNSTPPPEPEPLADGIADIMVGIMATVAPESDSTDAATGIADDDWCGEDGSLVDDQDSPEFVAKVEGILGEWQARPVGSRERDIAAGKVPSSFAAVASELVTPLVPRRPGRARAKE